MKLAVFLPSCPSHIGNRFAPGAVVEKRATSEVRLCGFRLWLCITWALSVLQTPRPWRKITHHTCLVGLSGGHIGISWAEWSPGKPSTLFCSLMVVSTASNLCQASCLAWGLLSSIYWPVCCAHRVTRTDSKEGEENESSVDTSSLCHLGRTCLHPSSKYLSCIHHMRCVLTASG